MSKHAFKKIMQGIEEARVYLEETADKSAFRIHISANGKKLPSLRPATGNSEQYGRRKKRDQ